VTQEHRPVVGVGAVVVHEGRVALIRRGKEPLKGRWVVPGGTVEWGEALEDAVVRELQEETGLIVRPRALLTVFDRIDRGPDGVRYHYVILDYLCELVAGELSAGSDAAEAAWVAPQDLARYDLPQKALEVVTDGFRHAGELGGLCPG
jgi:8-oxo-dGTP diphosphatase